MENDITRNVTIPLAEFLKIRDDADDLDILLETIFDGADLSYYDNRLRFNEERVNAVLRFIAPNRYREKVSELKKAEEED